MAWNKKALYKVFFEKAKGAVISENLKGNLSAVPYFKENIQLSPWDVIKWIIKIEKINCDALLYYYFSFAYHFAA